MYMHNATIVAIAVEPVNSWSA